VNTVYKSTELAVHLTIIINSIVCVIGAVAGALFAVASVISIANMTVPWRGALLVAALLLPVVFIAAGIGAWAADAGGAATLTIGLMALPWCYAVAFVAGMLVSFK
jgi:hypothetical protein